MKKTAIIGCGNLGMSIAHGLIDNKNYAAEAIYATRRNIAALDQLKESGVQVSSDNLVAVKHSEIIILAVKPYNVEKIIKEIKAELIEGQHIIVSVATGITIAQIKETLGDKNIPIFRAMPNTAADVNESVTAICTQGNHPVEMESVAAIFNQIGITIPIEEHLMEAATIMGACGIAYVLRFIRAMIQGGIQIGFDANTANAIVCQTVKGAAELLITGGQHPEFEIDKVTTPKGCTIVGLNQMEHSGFSSSLIKGIVSSFEKIEK